MQRQHVSRRIWISAIASAWLVVLCLGCDSGAPAVRFPIVVLVGVDGMRGDHLSRSGYPRSTTPFLDALAERSVAFERAYAASSRSLTSYASLFTGMPPGQHGVRQEGDGLGGIGTTLAEQLTERGYTTAAFVSTRRKWPATGLPRGFQHFSAPGPLHERRYRRGGETVDEALAWLADQPQGKPLFLWIQIEDPTKPLDPPPEAMAEALAGVDPSDLVAYILEKHRAPFGYFRYENRQVLRLINRYDGELRAADDALSRLYAGMEAGGGAGALWVVTSPHGMGLGNHLWEGAARQIYEPQVRVPLFFHAPGGEFSARTSDVVVSQLDVGAALLALVDGSDAPLEELLGGAGEGARGAFVQRGSLGPLPRNTGRIGQPQADPGGLDAWVEARWKLLRHTDGSEEVFDVAEDPYETRDRLADVPAEDLARLRAALDARQRAGALELQ
jgi:arylsulfatase